MKTIRKIVLLVLVVLLPVLAVSQESASAAPLSDADKLAKQLQNPLASLISVPFQNNFDFGF